MNMSNMLPIPVVFLGDDQELARRLAASFAEIVWEDEYRIAPFFQARSPREWPSALPAQGRGLVFVEIPPAANGAGGTEREAGLIRALRNYNEGLQIALLAEDDCDYFTIAQ